MCHKKNKANQDKDEQEVKSFWSILWIATLICLTICFLGILASYWFVGCSSESAEQLAERRGLFGDSWGGVNALISALAFAGVIATLYLQNADLKLQRKEMQEQRKEFEKENKTLKYQRFENLFYNMLNLQQEIVVGLRYDYQEKETILIPQQDSNPIPDDRKIDKVVTGREVFRYTFEDAQIDISEKGKLGKSFLIPGYRMFIHIKGFGAYDDTWIPTIYDHYFRHLYKIIQFVDKQDFEYEEAYKYVSLLRGTLSRYELVWIYYNALNPAYHKFRELIEKYSLLKNMREDLLTRSLELDKYYAGLRLSPQDLKYAKFSVGDFEYYLTDDRKDETKYYLTAFWKKDEIEKGKDWLNRWRMFVNDAAGRGKEEKG